MLHIGVESCLCTVTDAGVPIRCMQTHQFDVRIVHTFSNNEKSSFYQPSLRKSTANSCMIPHGASPHPLTVLRPLILASSRAGAPTLPIDYASENKQKNVAQKTLLFLNVRLFPSGAPPPPLSLATSHCPPSPNLTRHGGESTPDAVPIFFSFFLFRTCSVNVKPPKNPFCFSSIVTM